MSRIFWEYVLIFSLFDYLISLSYFFAKGGEVSALKFHPLFSLPAFLVIFIIVFAASKSYVFKDRTFSSKAFVFFGASFLPLIIVFGLISLFMTLGASQYKGGEGGWVVITLMFITFAIGVAFLVLTVANIILLYLLEKSRLKRNLLPNIFLYTFLIIIILISLFPEVTSSVLNYRGSYYLHPDAKVTTRKVPSGHTESTVVYKHPRTGEMIEARYAGDWPQYSGAINFITKSTPIGAKIVTDVFDITAHAVLANQRIAYPDWFTSDTAEAKLVKLAYEAKSVEVLDSALSQLGANYLWLTANTSSSIPLPEELKTQTTNGVITRLVKSDEVEKYKQSIVVYQMWLVEKPLPNYKLLYQDNMSKIYMYEGK